jgi:hypothetical protein
LRLAKRIELQLARGSYLPLIDAGVEMPVEQQVQSADYHLYCTDPRDGAAKFEFCTPERPSRTVQPGDPRTALGHIVVKVDPRAQPFRERLELRMTIDDDLILHAQAWSANVDDESATEFQNLEFGISMPGTSAVAEGGEPIPFDRVVEEPRQRGTLVTRANLALEIDDQLVPGELLRSYKPSYFDRRASPPQVQIDEWLYYEPCVLCGRSSNDPACHCAQPDPTE